MSIKQITKQRRNLCFFEYILDIHVLFARTSTVPILLIDPYLFQNQVSSMTLLFLQKRSFALREHMTITMRKLYKVMTCTLYDNQIYNVWAPLLDRELLN
jgi:hypothetical protein